MYRAAIKSIFSELVRQNRLVAIEKPVLEKPKTKEIASFLNEFSFISWEQMWAICFPAFSINLILGTPSWVAISSIWDISKFESKKLDFFLNFLI